MSARSIYPPYAPLAPTFPHLDAWNERLANWGRVNAGELRSLGYVLPCYAHREDQPGGDELDADKVEGMISEIRTAGGWAPHDATIRAAYLGAPKTWEQVGQIIRRTHPAAIARILQESPTRADFPRARAYADACRQLADRLCARLDVLDRAY